VSAGGYHTCGVQTDGTVACWGDETYGQAGPPLPVRLPDGTITDGRVCE
jgi:alpha-tubulin suppressor-like RCC1 family protein